MPQSLANILLHVVFSTKERRPFLRDPAIRNETHRYLGGILNGIACQSFLIGGVEDHVHVLCALARTCTAADMVKELKRSSSAWIKTRGADLGEFAWQQGYGVFSLGYSQMDEIRRYIENQEEHHRHITFQDEFRRFLERYHIAYDERYVWG